MKEGKIGELKIMDINGKVIAVWAIAGTPLDMTLKSAIFRKELSCFQVGKTNTYSC
ncbi:MAG: hypothetical protein IPM91_00005 [Bacteroidetes bacterium]|nr:hypothetical protein [Bacteroidota bacterium]